MGDGGLHRFAEIYEMAADFSTALEKDRVNAAQEVLRSVLSRVPASAWQHGKTARIVIAIRTER
jgi:hypothetical protein